MFYTTNRERERWRKENANHWESRRERWAETDGKQEDTFEFKLGAERWWRYPVHNNDWAVQPTYCNFLGLNELPSRGEKQPSVKSHFSASTETINRWLWRQCGGEIDERRRADSTICLRFDPTAIFFRFADIFVLTGRLLIMPKSRESKAADVHGGIQLVSRDVKKKVWSFILTSVCVWNRKASWSEHKQHLSTATMFSTACHSAEDGMLLLDECACRCVCVCVRVSAGHYDF